MAMTRTNILIEVNADGCYSRRSLDRFLIKLEPGGFPRLGRNG
jgi:hypothetical protein